MWPQTPVKTAPFSTAFFPQHLAAAERPILYLSQDDFATGGER